VTDDARAALEQRADGHLPLPLRRRLRAALPGHAERFALARATAEHVLGRWHAERPDDRRPEEMVELAERVRAGEADGDRAAIDAVAFADAAYELLDAEISEPALNAAMAAARLITAARWDDDAARLDEPSDDEDLDMGEWETDFYASMVDAPSLPKMGVPEHVEPRRAFWRWYVAAADRSH
jgi:hypothetical protein